MEFMTTWRSKMNMIKTKIWKNVPSFDYTKSINKKLPLLYIQKTFRVLENIGQNVGYRQKASTPIKWTSNKMDIITHQHYKWKFKIAKNL